MHEMIFQCLKEKGFPSDFINIIRDIYTGSTTNIVTRWFISKDIDIRKGTKQGCPVSPLLFNLCLEPLFNAINRCNADDGYSIRSESGETRFNILAYADDVLLISESESGMNKLLRTCERFCSFSKMQLAPLKSCSIGYVWNNRNRTGLVNSFQLNNTDIPFVGLDKSVRYLGTPVAARKVTKLKVSSDYLIKTLEKITKIFESELLTVQKLHAVRTFVFPALDFILENGQLKIKHIEMIDHKIAAFINKEFKGNVPTVMKHCSWKDGGLSIPCLREKAEACRVKALVRMLTNKDVSIKILAEKMLENERIT